MIEHKANKKEESILKKQQRLVQFKLLLLNLIYYIYSLNSSLTEYSDIRTSDSVADALAEGLM